MFDPPSVYACNGLHLLCTPSCIRLTHVGRWLNRRDEFQDGISYPNNANDGAKDIAEDMVVEEDGANKDINCRALAPCFWQMHAINSQTPLPRKENRKDA